MARKQGGRYSKEKATVRHCNHCGKAYKSITCRSRYCSDACRKSAHKQQRRAGAKPSASRKIRLEKKLTKLAVSSYGYWLAEQCRRCWTVEILRGHNKQSLNELHKLKKQAALFSRYEDGVPVESTAKRYELSHIFPANSHPDFVGLLTAKNLVIARGDWNRRNRALPVKHDDSLVQSRLSLNRRWAVNSDMSTSQVLKLIKRYLGKDFDDWLSGVVIPPTQREQLVAGLSKNGVRKVTHLTNDELRDLAEKHDVPVNRFKKADADVLEVIASEQRRLGISEAAALSVAVNRLREIENSFEDLPSLYERDRGEIRGFVIEQALRQLHRQSYGVSYSWLSEGPGGGSSAANAHVLEIIENTTRKEKCNETYQTKKGATFDGEVDTAELEEPL